MTEGAPACELHPVQGKGPGFYLIGRNGLVEAGPFPTQGDAEDHAAWLEEESLGVNPSPWLPEFSRLGLLIGSRYREPRTRRRTGQAPP